MDEMKEDPQLGAYSQLILEILGNILETHLL